MRLKKPILITLLLVCACLVGQVFAAPTDPAALELLPLVGLAVAPFDIQTRLTQIAMAVKPEGFIADRVLPRVQVPGQKFAYTKLTTEEAYRIPDTRVGRTSEPNTVEFGGADVTETTEDHGLDDPVPNQDIRAAAGTNFDPQAVAAERTAMLVELAREQRVAALLTTLTTYASTLRATLSGTDQWSDFVNSDPVGAILDAFDAMLMRPNVAILGPTVWTKLRRHPKVVEAIVGTGAQQGVASKQAVAELLELDELQVGLGFYTASKKGQTAAYTRLWGKHAAFLRIDRNVRNTQGGLPTFGMTAEWGTRIAGTIEEPKRGLEGATTVRVGEHVKEIVTFQDVGYFFQNAVA